MMSGVYEIVNTENGMRYVGSAVSLGKRKEQHFSGLRRGDHKNTHLQHAWNKYGENAFEFRVALECPSEDLIVREQERIDLYDFDELYNMCPAAGSRLGTKPNGKTRAKLSAAHSNPSAETRARMSAAAKGNQNALGHVRSEEVRTAHSAAMMGHEVSDDARAKLSAALTGRVLSDEHRAKISAANRNRSPETRAKISVAASNPSPETRAKMSAAKMGRVLSDETRAKMSVSQAARWQRERDGEGDNG